MLGESGRRPKEEGSLRTCVDNATRRSPILEKLRGQGWKLSLSFILEGAVR